MPVPRGARDIDQGNASIALVGGVAIVMILTVGLSDLAVFFLARTRAQTAADSAALAAAAELIPGLGSQPAAKAEEYATANGARLIACRCAPGSGVAEVLVSVPVTLTSSGFSGVREVVARAKAEVTSPRGTP